MQLDPFEYSIQGRNHAVAIESSRFIPTVYSPFLHNAPISCKLLVALHVAVQLAGKVRELQQFRQVVGVDLSGLFHIQRKVGASRLLRNARLQRTLDGETSKIIRALVVAAPPKRNSFPGSQVGQPLKISSRLSHW